MSKAFAFAGGRLGYLAADPRVRRRLRIVRLPYHLSAVTQAVAAVALRHAEELLAASTGCATARDGWRPGCAAQGLEVAESDANFVLFGRFADRHAVWQGLLDRGVLIREVGPPGWLRVSIGTPDEMAAFQRACWRYGAAHRGEPMSTESRASSGGPRSRGRRRAGPRRHRPGDDLDRRRLLRPHADRAGRHSLIDLAVQHGDLHVDAHHTVEDTAIVLGQAIRAGAGGQAGIRRFGDALVPLDEALAQAVVDVSGRPYCVHSGEPEGQEYVRDRRRCRTPGR